MPRLVNQPNVMQTNTNKDAAPAAHFSKSSSSSSSSTDSPKAAYERLYPDLNMAHQKGTAEQWEREARKEKRDSGSKSSLTAEVQQEGQQNDDYEGEASGHTPLIQSTSASSATHNLHPADASSRAPFACVRDGKFDLSPYVKPTLMDSVDRLTSPATLVMTAVKPCIKIAAKSLVKTDEPMSFQQLMDMTSDKYNEGKDKKNGSAASSAAASAPSRSSTSSTGRKRSIPERAMYFITMGLPLALLVGVLCGIRNFIAQVFTDLQVIVRTVLQLLNMAQADYTYYSTHQNELPNTEVVADAAVTQVLMPNAKRLVFDKLGYFQFLGRPIVNFAEARLRSQLTKGVKQIEKLRTRFGGQKTEAAQQASSE